MTTVPPHPPHAARRPLPTALLGLALGLALSATAAADFKKSFSDGVKAYDQQNWNEVVRHMKEALQDRPHADRVTVAIFSTKRVTYIPNTFLGIALYHLDRCEEAVPYFENAETQGIAAARERPYFAEMVEARSKCTAKLMETSIAAAGEAMQKASMMAANVDRMKSDPAAAAVMSQSPEIRQKLDRGMDLMEGAQQRLEAGTQARNFQIVRDAADYARRAEAELADLEKAMKQQMQAGVGEALESARQAIAAARTAQQSLERYRAEADVRAVWAGNAGLGRTASEGDDLLTRAERGVDAAAGDVAKIERASKDADAARAKFEEAQDQARQQVAQERRRRESADQIAAGARSAIAEAQRALEALDRYRGADELREAWGRNGRLGSREAELGSTLEQARTALAAGDRSKDSQQLGRAADLAERAKAGFQALGGEAQDLIAAARAAERPTSDATTIPTTPDADPAAPGRVSPPAALRSAVTAYFSGDYQGALDALDGEEFEEPRATAQACLFRAAARFALWQLGGRSDRTLREAIDRDLTAGKASDPSLRAEERFFPPPFVALVRSGG